MLTRLPNWQSSLGEYLCKVATSRFAYGRMDCGLFVAGAIHSMTGVDVAPHLRHTYSNRRDAFAAIKALCGRPTMEAVAEYLAAKHAIPEVPALRAQRGDAVLLRRGRASSLGIVGMHGTEILAPSKDGIIRLALSHATRAWHI